MYDFHVISLYPQDLSHRAMNGLLWSFSIEGQWKYNLIPNIFYNIIF